MCAKIRQIINNSAGGRSISLKFRTDFDHVTRGVPRTFKVNRSKVKVTSLHNVPASIKRHNSGTDKLSNLVKLFQSRGQHLKHVQGHKDKH